MTEAEALEIMGALAQTIRLRVVLALAEAGEVGIGSGEIAHVLGVPRNLMSSHLAVLSKAGAVVSVKNGRAVTYRIRSQAITELAGYLSTLVGAKSVLLTSACNDGSRTCRHRAVCDSVEDGTRARIAS